MDFPDEFADLIVSRGSYIFWEDLEKALLEIYRILAPGGKTYIGGGLGNEKLAAAIHKKMQPIQPGWPNTIHRRNRKITNEILYGMLERNGIRHEIIDNKGQGRWIIMSK